MAPESILRLVRVRPPPKVSVPPLRLSVLITRLEAVVPPLVMLSILYVQAGTCWPKLSSIVPCVVSKLESLFGSLIVPELVTAVDTVNVLLAMLKIALAFVIFRVGTVKAVVPATV